MSDSKSKKSKKSKSKKEKKLSPKHPFYIPVAFLFLGMVLGFFAYEITESPVEAEQNTYQYTTTEKIEQKPWMPKMVAMIDHGSHVLSYDARFKNPLWVYEDLTSESIAGEESREGIEFKEDTDIPTPFRAKLNDYRGSGLDRGHMAPAANHKDDAEALESTFYLSNMCPQCPDLNRGFWAKLERHVRDLTYYYSHVYVVTGPLYLSKPTRDGKKQIRVDVIGDNEVAVPTHFFKAIKLVKTLGFTETQAYIVPNEPIPPNTPIEKYRVSLDKIEKAAGIILSSK